MQNDPTSVADVRMHGFSRRSEVPAVLDWIDQHAIRLGAESVALDEAAGRILAADVVSPADVPGFDRAAMDGYALRGAETSGASEYNPLAFPVQRSPLGSTRWCPRNTPPSREEGSRSRGRSRPASTWDDAARTSPLAPRRSTRAGVCARRMSG